MDTKNIIKELVTKRLSSLVEDELDGSNIQQRGAGDKIEKIISDHVVSMDTGVVDILLESASSNRSMEDFQLTKGDQVYKFDIKTRDVGKDFSMPNLGSIDRIRKFYENINNHMLYVFVTYDNTHLDGEKVITILDIKVVCMEELDWSILTIGNLGKGQLQIKNMKNDLVYTDMGRENWYIELLRRGYFHYENTEGKSRENKNEWGVHLDYRCKLKQHTVVYE